jgi:peroxiredoxin
VTVNDDQRTPPIGVGEQAPPFTLPASTGDSVSLSDWLARGPVVLLWYVFDFGRI